MLERVAERVQLVGEARLRRGGGEPRGVGARRRRSDPTRASPEAARDATPAALWLERGDRREVEGDEAAREEEPREHEAEDDDGGEGGGEEGEDDDLDDADDGEVMGLTPRSASPPPPR